MNKSLSLSALLVSALLLGSPALVEALPSEQKLEMQVNRSTLIDLPARTKVFKLWMDDDKFAEIDSDVPINQGASLIYVIPRKSGSTRVSLVAKDDSGRTETYSLLLTASHGGISPASVAVNTPSPSPQSTNTDQSSTITSNDANSLRDGLSNALSSKAIAQGSMLHVAFEGAIADIENGLSLEEAASRNNLFVSALSKLKELSTQRPQIEQPSTQPKAPESQPPQPSPDAQDEDPKPSRVDDLIARVDNLESQLHDLNERQAKLEQEQETFIAQIDSQIDSLNQDVLALNKSIKPTYAYQLPPIKNSGNKGLGNDVSINPSEDTTAEDDYISLPVPIAPPEEVGPEIEIEIDNYTIANALIRGLSRGEREKLITYGEYYQVQSLVRLLRRGVEPERAIKNVNVPRTKIVTLLSWSDINLEE